MRSFCFLVLLPVVLSAKVDKKFVLDSFGLTLQDVEKALISALGSDVTEQACEAGCPAVINAIPGGSFVSGYLCPQACKSIQSSVGRKRFVLDSFGLTVQDVEQAIIGALGSDVTEHACEAGCPTIINAIPGGSLVSGFLCPQACKSIQSSVGRKRFVLDSFGLTVQDVEQAIIGALGSDVTEHACEAGCPTIINAIPGGSLVSGFLCPQACKSIQSSVGRKRFVLDSFGLTVQDVEQAIIGALGSDVTEHACEAGCPTIINAIPGGSLVSGFLCPQACKSIQSAAGKKRFVLDSFGLTLHDVEQAIISALGSDVTEHACEASCPTVINAIPGGSLVSGYLCPQACKSIQSAAGKKRFVLDSFGLTLQDVEKAVINALGSDVTEHACEAGCPAVINAIPGGSFVSGYLCPQACKSIQSAAGKKRFVLDSFGLTLQDVEKAIISTLGSDVTEHACEAGCPTVINAIPGGSLVSGYLCPQACKSIQSAASGKRGVKAVFKAR